MQYPDSMRASDADRQRVVDALQEQTGQGRLTLAEFEERSTTAYQATTLGQLRKLVTDLPVNPLPRNDFQQQWTAPWIAPQDVARMRTRAVDQRRALAMVPLAVLGVLVLSGAVSSLLWAGHMFFFPIVPLFFLFMVLRGGHGRPGYRR